jgi:hypothetical protein
MGLGDDGDDHDHPSHVMTTVTFNLTVKILNCSADAAPSPNQSNFAIFWDTSE